MVFRAYWGALRQYARVDGRTARAEFWGFALVHLGVLAALLVAGGLMGAVVGVNTTDLVTTVNVPALVITISVPAAVYSVATLPPTIGVAVRRLHDAGYTGWLTLLWFVSIPPFGQVILAVFLLLPSEVGDNRFGADPRGDGADGG